LTITRSSPSGSASLFSGTYYREIAESGDINVVDGAYYADGAGYKRLLFDDDVPDDFRVQADMTLGEQGKIRSGFIIRSHVNGAGVDNFSGYQCLLEKGYDEANPNRIDLILYKNGTRNTDDDYAWLGQVARAVNEGSGGWLAGLPNNGEGAKIRLVVEVKGSELSMYAYCLDDPAMKTQVLRADLKTPGDFDDKKQEYFDSGAVALTTSWYPAAIENVQIAPLSEAGEAGPLDTLESYDLYTTFGGTFLEKDGWFVAAQPGTKRAIVKNLEITDFSASMTAALDGNGNICKIGFFDRHDFPVTVNKIVLYVKAVRNLHVFHMLLLLSSSFSYGLFLAGQWLRQRNLAFLYNSFPMKTRKAPRH